MICDTETEWRLRVLERDGSRDACSGAFATAAHHIIPRRYLAVRLDTDNGLSVSVHTHLWLHGQECISLRYLLERNIVSAAVYCDVCDRLIAAGESGFIGSMYHAYYQEIKGICKLS
jgi:hypothetical protein